MPDAESINGWLSVDLVSESPMWTPLAGLHSLVVRVLNAASREVRAGGAEVTVVLADDALQRQLNRQWRGKETSTNVLSFPAAPVPGGSDGPLGDIVLAFETVQREAEEQGKTLEAHVAHLALHGFLHLVGYDHLSEAEADRMEGLEALILARFGFADPYEERSLAGDRDA